jgi:hypothetical protein
MAELKIWWAKPENQGVRKQGKKKRSSMKK